MVFGVRCDVDIFKLTASAHSIYREVWVFSLTIPIGSSESVYYRIRAAAKVAE